MSPSSGKCPLAVCPPPFFPLFARSGRSHTIRDRRRASPLSEIRGFPFPSPLSREQEGEWPQDREFHYFSFRLRCCRRAASHDDLKWGVPAMPLPFFFLARSRSLCLVSMRRSNISRVPVILLFPFIVIGKDECAEPRRTMSLISFLPSPPSSFSPFDHCKKNISCTPLSCFEETPSFQGRMERRRDFPPFPPFSSPLDLEISDIRSIGAATPSNPLLSPLSRPIGRRGDIFDRRIEPGTSPPPFFFFSFLLGPITRQLNEERPHLFFDDEI